MVIFDGGFNKDKPIKSTLGRALPNLNASRGNFLHEYRLGCIGTNWQRVFPLSKPEIG
jgi:hypothetical protein